ncbi:TetR/AcrR family transcriptional regulator [Erwinia sp. S63]|uniref:TetR/AcrR family transcriptional regulator n=1 Tax=Erwiniaceae TaxID=1903409 RepID=UPI0019090EA4|nr:MULTISPECIES: TetR/AcrR family transcriptional regulator [Erwiniaceae]MBK0004794.1 TetR/AcrR family transcriptional regulator [Erwinia sp. S38]MBK0093611.1 TetR/AcrR family transcriptional regulator [Erwinia sp. S59]MBK0099330.1 TetR/AcrR family transcriptional regulator [Erwinia sp. S63]MBK0127320.1 TetR/AcrR family transcriptional regulator [Pantoea sp. S61]
MKREIHTTLIPRKTPQQRRSAETIEAIFAAAIQVLRMGGSSDFTTTKVAERAGTSVGTLYQYFPNKHALLYAVLSHHLGRIASAFEVSCLKLECQCLAEIGEGLVKAYLNAKTFELEASVSLYSAVSHLDASEPVRDMIYRMRAAIKTVLINLKDAFFSEPDEVAFFLQNMLSGTTRAVFESLDREPIDSIRKLEADLLIICSSYLQKKALLR